MVTSSGFVDDGLISHPVAVLFVQGITPTTTRLAAADAVLHAVRRRMNSIIIVGKKNLDWYNSYRQGCFSLTKKKLSAAA